TKTWAVTSVGADARRAAARAKPPHARHMGVIVQSGRPMTHVGRAARRREDPPLLRGEGRFLDDLRIEGVAHVVFVRSPHAHARAAAHRTVAVDVRQARLAGVPLEPRAVAARWADDLLTIWSSTQVPHRIRDEVARLLALAPERVRVIAPDVGGGFGVKGGPYREEVLIPWLARRLGGPVKWISTRVEDLLTTHHGRGAVARGELAVAADGTMLGLRARILCPLGPSVGYTAMGTPRNHVRCLPGPYAIADVEVEAVGAFTTTPPVGPYRGAGRPEAAFLMERLVDEAARALALDPAELRRRNLVPPERFPVTTATRRRSPRASGRSAAAARRSAAAPWFMPPTASSRRRGGSPGTCSKPTPRTCGSPREASPSRAFQIDSSAGPTSRGSPGAARCRPARSGASRLATCSPRSTRCGAAAPSSRPCASSTTRARSSSSGWSGSTTRARSSTRCSPMASSTAHWRRRGVRSRWRPCASTPTATSCQER